MDTSTYLKLGAATVSLGLLDACYRIFLVPTAKYPCDKIVSLAQLRFGNSDMQPLQHKVAIVTGSTSGLGQEIAGKLYGMGATVVLASRSKNKILATKEVLEKQYPNSKGNFITEQTLDTSDLTSVASFAKWFTHTHKELHFLVNNAGIVYLPAEVSAFDANNPPISKQGYEQAFATNYLGHFLLTDMLLKVLMATPQARVVSIASSAHLLVDGTVDLKIANGMPPPASLPAKNSVDCMNAYSRSKLAQIMHAKELQRELDSKSGHDVKIISVCPGFTATGMLPNNPVGNILRKIFFPVEAASYTPMHCLFSNDITGGAFMTNFHNFWTNSIVGIFIFKLCVALGLRSLFFGALAVPWVIAFQNSSYGVHKCTPDDAVVNDKLTSDMFHWSRAEVKKYIV